MIQRQQQRRLITPSLSTPALIPISLRSSLIQKPLPISKVKRKGYFYHLSDSMLVKSAFVGAKKNWFLLADASCAIKHNENLYSCKPDAGSQLPLLCVRDYFTGRRNDILPDGPCNRSYVISESLFAQSGIDRHGNLRVPNAEQSGAEYACKEVSKDLDMQTKHIAERNFSNSDIDVLEKHDLNGKNTFSVTTAEHKDDNAIVGIGHIQCNISHEGTLQIMHAVRKNHKISKNASAVCDLALKDAHHASSKETSDKEIVGWKNSIGSPGREKSNEQMMGNTDTCGKPCKTDKSNDRIDDIERNNSIDETSESRPTARKKRKRENRGRGSFPKETKALVSNSLKDTSKAEAIIPETSNRQKRRNATLENFSAELEDDVHLKNSSSSTKSKRKSKSSATHDQIIQAVLSSLHETEECFKEHEKINPKDLGRTSGTLYDQGIQHAEPTKTLEIYSKEKLSETVQADFEGSRVSHSSIEGNKDDSEPAGGVRIEGTKYLKKLHANDMNGDSLLPVEEFDYPRKDIVYSGDENTVTDGHKFKNVHTNKIQEKKELSCFYNAEAKPSESGKHLNSSEADTNVKQAEILVKFSDADIIRESGNSAGGRKKRANKCVGSEQVASEAGHINNFGIDMTSTAAHSGFNHCLNEAKKEENKVSYAEESAISKYNIVDASSVAADGKGHEMSGNGVGPSQPTLINENQENAANMDGKFKKKQSFSTKTLSGLPNEVQRNEEVSLQLNRGCRNQEEAENVDRKSSKKTQKDQSSWAKTHSDLPIKQQGNVEELLQLNQINKTQKDDENGDSKLKKRKRGTPTSTELVFPIEEQGRSVAELASSIDRMSGVSTPFKMKKKTESVKESTRTQLSGSESELEKNIDTEGAVHSKLEFKSHPEGAPVEISGDDSALKKCCENVVNNQMLNSMCEGDMINFKDYFVPVRKQHEVDPAEVLVDEAKRSDKELEVEKNMTKLVLAKSTSPDLKNTLNTHENLGSDKKSQIRYSRRRQLQDLSMKEDHDKIMLQSNKKFSEVSKNVTKDAGCVKVDQIKSTAQAAGGGNVNGSGINSSAPAYPKKSSKSANQSSSCSESSVRSVQQRRDNKNQLSWDHHSVTIARASGEKTGEIVNNKNKSSFYHPSMTITRASGKDTGEAVNNKNQSSLDHPSVTIARASGKKTAEFVNHSQKGKRLFSSKRGIFRDDSSESSEDDGVVHSDASIYTPDDSSSSSYSEGESNLSLPSRRKGSIGVKRKADGGRNITKLGFARLMNLNVSTILRNSSRFKKAKLAAAQSQPEDIASEPVDSVPVFVLDP